MKKKYVGFYDCITTYSVEIEAENIDEAVELFYEKGFGQILVGRKLNSDKDMMSIDVNYLHLESEDNEDDCYNDW